MTDAEEMYQHSIEVIEHAEKNAVEVGWKLKSKVHGHVFEVTDSIKKDLDNDNLGEWWNLFEKVPDDTPVTENLFKNIVGECNG
jgi:hypothetical protein